MEQLKRFNKYKNGKKKLIIALAFLLVGIFLIRTSYAVYQREDEVQFINATVRWPKASEVTYTNTSNSNVKNVEQALNDLYGKLGK